MGTKEIGGIDLGFRPRTYFWPLNLQTHWLSRIKGAERQAELRRLIDEGRAQDLPQWLTESALSVDDRQGIGRIHPRFMGGEYLPNLRGQEVMVARITIASTTQDVTCVYASRGKRCIHYRVVDDYGGDTLTAPTRRTSIRPLTLGQLATFFDSAWSIIRGLEANFDPDCDVEELQDFVVAIDSEFYPQLDALLCERIAAWAEQRRSAADDG